MGIGIPSGGESLSYNLSQIVIQRMINILGAAVISTKAYASIFANFSYVYGMAVSQAGQIMVGFKNSYDYCSCNICYYIFYK